MARQLTLANLPGYKKSAEILKKFGTPRMRTVIGALFAHGRRVVLFSLGIIGLKFGLGGLLSSNLFKFGLLASLPQLWGFVVNTVQYVFNFNWNITDKELDQQIEAKINTFYGMIGQTAGTAMGYLVCGALPGAVSFAFNPTVARVVLANVGEEAKSEVYGQIAQISRGCLNTLVQAAVGKSFKSSRRWLKNPKSPFYKILKDKLGDKFTNWGESAQPSFSFNQSVENRVEKIKDPRLKNFTQEFLENFSESCIEAGYIVTTSIYEQMAAMKLMQEQQQQPTPDPVVAIQFRP